MSRVRAVYAFVAAVMKSLVRDRTSMFFMAVLPVVVIVVIGTTYGGTSTIRLGIVAPPGSTTATALRDRLADEAFELSDYASVDDAASAVRRGKQDGAMVVVDDTTVQLITAADQDSVTIRTAVSGVVADLSARLTAAELVATDTGTDPATAAAAVAAADSAPATVTVTNVDGNAGSSTISRFSLTVPQNLVLFTFINGAASAGFLVRTRREGVMTRAMSSPASTGTLLAGLGIGWFAVALFQSLLIVVIGAVVFGMDWGNPLAAGILVVLWALVGAGAGLLVGAVADNPDRVSAISPPVGIVLGALGGCMIPFEVFSPTMQSIAKAVPHTWALNGWRTLVFDGGGVADIRGSIAVLSVWVAALLTAASVLLRRRLTSGS